MAYASGKHSIAICDRCGFQYKYTQLREEWNGFRVCSECFEPKHPQLEPGSIAADAQALENARPQEQHVVTVSIGKGADSVFSVASSGSMQPATLAKDLTIKFNLGTVTVS